MLTENNQRPNQEENHLLKNNKEPKLGDFRIIEETNNYSGDTKYYIQRYSRFFYFWRKWKYIVKFCGIFNCVLEFNTEYSAKQYIRDIKKEINHKKAAIIKNIIDVDDLND